MKISTFLTLIFLYFSVNGYSQSVSHDFNWVPVSTVSTANTTVQDCATSITLAVSTGTFRRANNPTLPNPNLNSVIINFTDNAQQKTITVTFGTAVTNPSIRIGDLDAEGTTPGSEFLDNFSVNPVSVTQPLSLLNGNTVVASGNNNDGWLNWAGTYTQISFTYNRPGRDYGLFIDSLTYNCGCCEGERKNLVLNGDFESGNSSFTSQYSFSNNDVLPEQYSILNTNQASQVCNNWNIDDSQCNGTGQFMVVNGNTNQPIGSTHSIWNQTIQDMAEGRYELCLNLKGLPSCCFDITPNIIITIGSTQFMVPISSDANPCQWMNLAFPYVATDNTPVTIDISLQESGIGDGNDFAIDNIHFSQLVDMQLYHSVTGTSSTPVVVNGSIWLPGSSDDNIGNGCQYSWEIQPQNSIGPITNPLWGLTTNFSGFSFLPNTTYEITLVVKDCDCLQDASTSTEINVDSKGRIRVISDSRSTKQETSPKNPTTKSIRVLLHPNPASNSVYLTYDKKIKDTETPIRLTLYNSVGKAVLTQNIIDNQFSVHGLPKGIYYAQITTNGYSLSKKLTIQ